MKMYARHLVIYELVPYLTPKPSIHHSATSFHKFFFLNMYFPTFDPTPDSIADSVFVLFYLTLTNTIRNKNQKNSDCETSWLLFSKHLKEFFLNMIL